MSDQDQGVTDTPVAATETQDDFKGLIVESDGERLNETKKSDPVEDKPVLEGEDKPEVEQKPKRPGKVERLLAKEQAEKAELLARLEKLEKAQPANKSEAPVVEGPPNSDDYPDVLDFIAADRQYAIDQALKAFLEGQVRNLTEAETKEKTVQRDKDFSTREAVIISENPEYSDTVQSMYEEGLITAPMIEAFKDSPVGEKVALHLTQNQDDAEILSQLKGPAFYKALGILEAHLSGNTEEKTVQRQTKATAPIAPVRSSANTDSDPTKMNLRDFDKWMKV